MKRPTPKDPTVFVVDDDRPMRRSLGWLLESVGLVVETFATAEEFLASWTPERPGCLVLDVRMPGLSGLELQAELVRRGVGVPTIVITGHAEVPMAVRALKSGAVDFLEKPFSDQLLLDRVHEALEIDRQARDAEERRSMAERRLADLTAREREVLELVVAGHTSREIAERLRVSPRTVEVHRARVMEKMGATSLAELVRLALDGTVVRS